MGAIINLEPKLYKASIRSAFRWCLTTMSDESIPLTTFEYKEWGNLKKKKEYFYMKKYSPYDNISFKPYPSVLVTSSLYDSQVQYFEPAKYVPKLREHSTSGNPVLLKMNMIGGMLVKVGDLLPEGNVWRTRIYIKSIYKRFLTNFPIARDAVRPGLSIPCRFTKFLIPWSSAVWILKSRIDSLGFVIFGLIPA